MVLLMIRRVRLLSPAGYDAKVFVYLDRATLVDSLIRDDLHRDEWSRASSRRLSSQAVADAQIKQYLAAGWIKA